MSSCDWPFHSPVAAKQLGSVFKPRCKLCTVKRSSLSFFPLPLFSAADPSDGTSASAISHAFPWSPMPGAAHSNRGLLCVHVASSSHEVQVLNASSRVGSVHAYLDVGSPSPCLLHGWRNPWGLLSQQLITSGAGHGLFLFVSLSLQVSSLKYQLNLSFAKLHQTCTRALSSCLHERSSDDGATQDEHLCNCGCVVTDDDHETTRTPVKCVHDPQDIRERGRGGCRSTNAGPETYGWSKETAENACDPRFHVRRACAVLPPLATRGRDATRRLGDHNEAQLQATRDPMAVSYKEDRSSTQSAMRIRDVSRRRRWTRRLGLLCGRLPTARRPI